MKIDNVKVRQDNGLWIATFRYWEDDECACLAKKATKPFSFQPTNEDLISSVS